MATMLGLSPILLPGPASAAQGDCAQPASTGAAPSVTDCLYILRTAVGTVECEPECVCAPKGSLPATALDALLCLKTAVGQSIALNCPCGAVTTTTTTTGNETTTTTTGATTTTLVSDTVNFPSACLKFWLRRAFAAPVEIISPGHVEMAINRNSIDDRDADGREEVVADLFFMEFEATSDVYGDIKVEVADPAIHPELDHATRGLLEEKTNTKPGRLDLSPYAPTGEATATFDVFFQVLMSGETAGGRAHNDVAIVMSADVTGTRPEPHEVLVMSNTTNIPLLRDRDGSFFSISIDAGTPATLNLNSLACE
jgi:hypothetical protein